MQAFLWEKSGPDQVFSPDSAGFYPFPELFLVLDGPILAWLGLEVERVQGSGLIHYGRGTQGCSQVSVHLLPRNGAVALCGY